MLLERRNLNTASGIENKLIDVAPHVKPLESESFQEKASPGSLTINQYITNNYYTSGEMEGGALKPIDSYSMPKTVFIEESKISVDLVKLLARLNEIDEDASRFEQIRASFLSKFRALKKLRNSREPYFYDLFQMIDLSVTYLEFETVSSKITASLISAIGSLCSKLDADDLKKIRKEFRESKIQFLPVVEEIDFEREIKDFYSETPV